MSIKTGFTCSERSHDAELQTGSLITAEYIGREMIARSNGQRKQIICFDSIICMLNNFSAVFCL